MKIIIQIEGIIGNKADSVASLKFIILCVTRIANWKIIVQSENIRGNKADSVASLKFIILGVTRVAN